MLCDQLKCGRSARAKRMIVVVVAIVINQSIMPKMQAPTQKRRRICFHRSKTKGARFFAGGCISIGSVSNNHEDKRKKEFMSLVLAVEV